MVSADADGHALPPHDSKGGAGHAALGATGALCRKRAHAIPGSIGGAVAAACSLHVWLIASDA